MSSTYLIRHSEIHLKGKNRPFFERVLLKNIRQAFSAAGIPVCLQNEWRRMSVTVEQETIIAREILSNIFGIISFSPVKIIPSELATMIENAKTAVSSQEIRAPLRFRVSVNRVDKNFPLSSMQSEEKIGAALLKEFPQLRVDLKHFDLEIGIEIQKEKSSLYTESCPGLGGLPVGCGDRVLTLLSGGIDSPVAAWLAMKRGSPADFISFYSPPYVSPLAREKIFDLAKHLSRYQGDCTLFIAPFTAIQEEIRRKAPESLRTLLYRRAMQRVATAVASLHHHQALITGESLGQVSSQTLSNISAIESASDITILRPLITFDKEETIRLARRIGTYEISVRPYLDCCTVFQPRRPALKARLADLLRAESRMALAQLLSEAVGQIEAFAFSGGKALNLKASHMEENHA